MMREKGEKECIKFAKTTRIAIEAEKNLLKSLLLRKGEDLVKTALAQ